jgi:hypothetical protein
VLGGLVLNHAAPDEPLARQDLLRALGNLRNKIAGLCVLLE